MTTFEHIQENYPSISRPHAEALGRYGDYGMPPCDFLRAVLSNDLMEAMGSADRYERAELFQICCFIHCDLPDIGSGSYENVQRWIDRGGVRGIQDKPNALEKISTPVVTTDAEKKE